MKYLVTIQEKNTLGGCNFQLHTVFLISNVELNFASRPTKYDREFAPKVRKAWSHPVQNTCALHMCSRTLGRVIKAKTNLTNKVLLWMVNFFNLKSTSKRFLSLTFFISFNMTSKSASGCKFT